VGGRAARDHTGRRALNGPLRLLAAAVLLVPLAVTSRATAFDPSVDAGCLLEADRSVLAGPAARACAAALPRVQELLPVTDVRVVVPRDDAEAARLVPQAGDLSGVAAVATEDRVVLVPSGFGELTPTGQRVVLAHEIAHLATRAWTTERTPLWLVEGLAEQVAFTAFPLPEGQAAAELARDVRAGVLPHRLPADDAFGGPRAAQAYQQSWLAVDLLSRRYGDEALLAAYRRAGVGGTAAALRGLGLAPRELLAAWRSDLRRRLA